MDNVEINNDILLRVKNLGVKFKTLEGDVTATEGISFEIKKGEVLGIVGESGCGKSLTALSLIRLVEQPGIVKSEGVLFEEQDISLISEREMRKVRGNRISMIFQEPQTSLNPLFTIGNQMDEVFRLHRGVSNKVAHQESIEMLHLVGIPDPESIYKRYPSALSGGMCQRVMIAMALSCRPKLLIADEPTTALDVTIQKQILILMKDLRKEFNTSIILITHDLGVVAEMADRVIVMYAGEIIEQASVFELFEMPLHPYTEGLIKSTITLGCDSKLLPTIPGTVPTQKDMPTGCRFHPRCSYAMNICAARKPVLTELLDGRIVRCLRYEKDVVEAAGEDYE